MKAPKKNYNTNFKVYRLRIVFSPINFDLGAEEAKFIFFSLKELNTPFAGLAEQKKFIGPKLYRSKQILVH